MANMFRNLILPEYQEKSFYHALRTKGFVILAGLSGTGKTKIFEEIEVCKTLSNVKYKYSDVLNDSITAFKKTFEDFFDMLDKDLKNFNYINNYDTWKKALDKWTNVWPEDTPKNINIVSVVTSLEFTKKRLKNDDKLKVLIDLAELSNMLGITEDDIRLVRKAERGLYQFIINGGTISGPVSVSSAQNDVSIAIEKFNIQTIFPILCKILKVIKSIKNEEDVSNQKDLGQNVVNLFRIILNKEKTFSEQDLLSLLPTNANLTDEIYKKFFTQAIQSHDNRAYHKLFFPIRPDFKDSKSLLGYYNPLSNVYQSTELLDFILKAQKEYVTNGKSASPYLVLFDEMNLARVEYYFADFLSVLESKRIRDVNDVDDKMTKHVKDKENKEVTKSNLIGFYSKPILLHDEDDQNIKIPQKLYLPPNLYFVGSVNIDETTHMFSPKVLDRAFTIEFDADMDMYVQRISEQQGDKQCCIKKQDTKTSETKEGTNEHNEDDEKSEDVQTAPQKDSDDTSKQSATTSNQKDAQCFELTDFIRWGEFAMINKDCVREIAGYEFQSNTKDQSKKSYQDILNEIFSILKPYGLHFGYRVFDEVMMFMCNATVATKDDYKMTDIVAFDLAIKMKILPKFHGTRQKLEAPIKRLIGYCENEQKTQDYLSPKSIPILTTSSQNGNVLKVKLDDKVYDFLFPHTARKLIEMLYKLQTQGFAGFM